MSGKVHLSTALADLDPIVHEWIRITSEVVERFARPGDYQHVERMYVSLFSSASWLCGVPSVVELPVMKHAPKASARGHVDLMIHLQAGDLVAESKRKFVNHPKEWEGLLGMLQDAEAEVSRLSTELAPRRLALVFGVFETPSVPLSKLLSPVYESLKAKAPDLDLLACCTARREDLDYPGCIVLGRLVLGGGSAAQRAAEASSG